MSPFEKMTSGGGHIYMNIDSIHLEGDGTFLTIEANAWPIPDPNRKQGTYYGGSGGYIHIKTANKIAKRNNALSDAKYA